MGADTAGLAAGAGAAVGFFTRLQPMMITTTITAAMIAFLIVNKLFILFSPIVCVHIVAQMLQNATFGKN